MNRRGRLFQWNSLWISHPCNFFRSTRGRRSAMLPPRITSSEIQPSYTAISQIRSPSVNAPRVTSLGEHAGERASERTNERTRKARTPCKGGKRSETKKSMALRRFVHTILADKSFSNRLTVDSLSIRQKRARARWKFVGKLKFIYGNTVVI